MFHAHAKVHSALHAAVNKWVPHVLRDVPMSGPGQFPAQQILNGHHKTVRLYQADDFPVASYMNFCLSTY